MRRLREALLYRVEDGRVVCGVCLRGCRLRDGQRGLCGNYAAHGGRLYHIGYGLVSALESRPIEIKPLFHFHPGSTAMTFSGWGCNFLCPWCQNYLLSKRPPDPASDPFLGPEAIVEAALEAGDAGVCASFNEPTVFFDYVYDVFRLAKKKGLYTVIVSNGSLTMEALGMLIEAGLDAISLDIKGCQWTYRRYLGVPDPLHPLRIGKAALEKGVHVEAVYLVVTGANDTEDCIRWVIEKHLEYLGPETPLHINRYYPAYRYHEPPTPMEKLLWIYRYAGEQGIKYRYIGNIPTTRYMTTRCPRCGATLITRTHYTTTSCRIINGRCPRCGYRINIRGECRGRGQKNNKNEIT